MRQEYGHAFSSDDLTHSQDNFIYTYLLLYKFSVYLCLFYFYFGPAHGTRNFLGHGLNPNFNCNLCHSCSKTGSLTLCTKPGMEPMPQQQPKLLQRPYWSPNPLHHNRNFLFLKILSKSSFLKETILSPHISHT